MLDVYDDEEKRQRMLEELLQGGTTGTDVVQLPEMTITADRQQLQPQTGPLAARDETSPTRAPEQTLPDHTDEPATPPEPDASATSPIPQAAPSTQSANPADRAVADFEKRVAEAKAQRARQSNDIASLEAGPSRSTNHTAGDIDTVLAMLLDLGANKGRGLGQITGAYASNREADDREQRQHEERMALAQARHKASQDPLEELLRTDAAERGIRGLYAREGHEAGVQGRAEHGWAQNESPDAPKQTTAVEVTRRKAEAGVEGKTAEESALAADIQRNARGKSGATAEGSTEATTNELRKNPREITKDEQARLDLAAQTAADAAASRKINEDRAAKDDRQRQTNDFNTKYGGAIETLTAAQTLEHLIGEHGDIEGVGPIVGSRFMPDALKSDKAIQEQQALAAFQNPGFLARSGKAVTPTEAPRLEAEFGNLKSTNPEVVHNAVKAIAETMRNTIKRGSVGREDIAREVLSSQHLDDVLGPAVVEDAPASARDALPQVKAEDKAQGKKLRHLKLPSGKTIRAQLSDDELDTAIAGGAKEL